MKAFFTKNWKTILILAIILIALWYFLGKKKPAAVAVTKVTTTPGSTSTNPSAKAETTVVPAS